MFSGVLMVTAGKFFFTLRADDVVLNCCTHDKIVFQSGTLADDKRMWKALVVAITDSPFLKNVLFTKTHCFLDDEMVTTGNYIIHRSE